jgi:hypothetical protein
MYLRHIVNRFRLGKRLLEWNKLNSFCFPVFAGSAIRIVDLPDPQGRYGGLLQTYPQLLDMKVLVPDVLDPNGLRISPPTTRRNAVMDNLWKSRLS